MKMLKGKVIVNYGEARPVETWVPPTKVEDVGFALADLIDSIAVERARRGIGYEAPTGLLFKCEIEAE